MIRKVLPYVVVFVLAALGFYLWNREHRLRTDAEREAEAMQLQLKGQLIEVQINKDALADAVDGLTVQNSELNAALGEAKKAAADAKAVTAAKLDTGPLRVKNAPRPGHGNSTSTSSPPTEQRTTECPAPVACILAADDKIAVQVDVLELQTRKGNTIVVGTAEVFRTDPPPRTSLASGRFQSSLSTAQSLGTLPPPRWGFFGLGACGTSGCGPGGGVLFPAFDVPLFGWRAEPILGVIAAPGAPLVIGGLGFRL